MEIQLISVSHPLQDGSVDNAEVPFIMLISDYQQLTKPDNLKCGVLNAILQVSKVPGSLLQKTQISCCRKKTFNWFNYYALRLANLISVWRSLTTQLKMAPICCITFPVQLL